MSFSALTRRLETLCTRSPALPALIGVRRLLRRGDAGEFPRRSARAAKLTGPTLSPYEAWLSVNRLTSRDRGELAEELASRAGRLPRISLITPVYDTDPQLFEELLEAVLGQIYQDWELCIIDDASPSPHVAPMLEKAAARDGRIRIGRLDSNGGISAATNAAVEMATGEYVAFLDHDDLITPDCLAEFALLLADDAEIDMAYSDDDKIDVDGRRHTPQFKPDWSPVLLLSFMYMSHMLVVRRSVFRDLGGFRSEFNGSQDYDFALRAAEVIRRVGHIPRILYHWRAVEGSTAVSAEGKPRSLEAGRRAVEEALVRRGVAGARAIHPDWASKASVGRFELRFPEDGPSVTIIIPASNSLDRTERCLRSLEKTTYRNAQVMVVVGEGEEHEARRRFGNMNGLRHVRVAISGDRDGGEANQARIRNIAAGLADTEFVLFLDDSTEILVPGWLSQMMGYAQMDDVGAVGARLYSEDGRIEHAGITHGHNEGLTGHAFRGLSRRRWGYLGLVRASRECAGVSGACLLTRRSLLKEIGGFDEDAFPVSYHDADFCFRLVKNGQRCIYACNAELLRHDSSAQGDGTNTREQRNYRLRYGNLRDRWYNPNLSLDSERFTPTAIRPQSRRKEPVRILGITHNLNNEGAPTTFLDLCIGMKETGLVDPIILSPADGPLRAAYEAAGIEVIVRHFDFRRVKGREPFEATLSELTELIRILDIEVVVANTLQAFWGILGARETRLPAIWCQHESESWTSYYDFLPVDVRKLAYQGFGYAYRVLYVAEATRRAWRTLETRHNFELIRHGIPPGRLASETQRWTREAARKMLDVDDNRLCVVIVGTVSHRKGQLDLARAIALLPEELQKNLTAFIVGPVAEQGYGRQIARLARRVPTARVVQTGRIDDPFAYYALADIALCTSRTESAPRVLVEAMACGLPIITTPVYGIPELVRRHVNALYYEPGKVRALASAIERLWKDRDLRTKLAHNSPPVLASQPDFADMVDKYCKVIREAANLEY